MGNVDKVDRTLALNEMMYHVRRDAALRRRFVDDLDGLGREFGLSAAEVEALRDRDVRRLSDLGVHQYYIPQILRLIFGTAAASNAHPAPRGLQARLPGGLRPGDGRAAGRLSPWRRSWPPWR